ncbi:hypothetical protein D1007_38049 [Hordeum vulgare]|nr:hypothetical protein D1007_38049 [Hordeum vulgare]
MSSKGKGIHGGVATTDRAYDLAVWRLKLPRLRLDFPKIESRVAVEFVGPLVTIESSPMKPTTCIVIDERDTICESDEDAIANLQGSIQSMCITRWSSTGGVISRTTRMT